MPFVRRSAYSMPFIKRSAYSMPFVKRSAYSIPFVKRVAVLPVEDVDWSLWATLVYTNKNFFPMQADFIWKLI